MIKNSFCLLLFLLLGFSISAQNKTPNIPISIGYFGHFLYQPGLKVGTHFEFKNWQTEKACTKGDITKAKSYFVSPQIGYYNWSGRNYNFLLNADIGYRRVKVERRSYSAFSIGLGYLATSELISVVRNLNDGKILAKNRMHKGYFLSTINYEFGRAINSRLGWYNKYSVGKKWSPNNDGMGVIFVELGVNFSL